MASTGDQALALSHASAGQACRLDAAAFDRAPHHAGLVTGSPRWSERAESQAQVTGAIEDGIAYLPWL